MRLVDLMAGSGCSGYRGCAHMYLGCSASEIGSMSGSLVAVEVEVTGGSSISAKADLGVDSNSSKVADDVGRKVVACIDTMLAVAASDCAEEN